MFLIFNFIYVCFTFGIQCRYVVAIYTGPIPLVIMLILAIYKALILRIVSNSNTISSIKLDIINYLTMFSLPMLYCITIVNNLLCVIDCTSALRTRARAHLPVEWVLVTGALMGHECTFL